MYTSKLNQLGMRRLEPTGGASKDPSSGVIIPVESITSASLGGVLLNCTKYLVTYLLEYVSEPHTSFRLFKGLSVL